MGEPDPALTATMDQVGASLESQAAVLGQFFRKLLSESFERDEAHDLVRDYFLHVLEGSGAEDD